MKRNILTVLCLIFCSAAGSFAQQATTEVDWFSNGSPLLTNLAGTPLSQGAANMNSDGFLVQLGYFTGSTGVGFTGTWTPITGAIPANRTAIGDSADLSGAGNGVIAFDTVFHSGTNTPVVFENDGGLGTYATTSAVTISGTTPPPNQVLGIRIYDTADGQSGMYNTVEASNWNWQAPTELGATVLVNLATTTATLVWEDPNNPFKTSLAIVPEPSSIALVGFGLAALAFARKRKAS